MVCTGRKDGDERMAKGKYEYWLTPEGQALLAGWARAGLTEEQISHNMGINRTTLYEWKAKYPDISNTLKKGKEVVDLEVENALLKRALGYDYEEKTEELRVDRKTGKKKMVVTRSIHKHAPPDITALIFWLKNRMPDRWKDKQAAVEIGLDDGANEKIKNFLDAIKPSDNELRSLFEEDGDEGG